MYVAGRKHGAENETPTARVDKSGKGISRDTVISSCGSALQWTETNLV